MPFWSASLGQLLQHSSKDLSGQVFGTFTMVDVMVDVAVEDGIVDIEYLAEGCFLQCARTSEQVLFFGQQVLLCRDGPHHI
jgi:hypothetical protein